MVVVGSINLDLVVRVERLPRPGETVAGGSLERHGGGKGANQAVAAARAGAEVHFLGAVGEDDFGAQALEELQREGIDVDGITRLSTASTGLAAIVVDDQGENQIAVASGANAELDPQRVEQWLRRLDPPAEAVCLLNLEIPDPPLVTAARWASEAGIATLVVNPAPARALPHALLELGPILTPNAGELAALAGYGAEEADPEPAARELSGRSGAPVIVTLGAEGAIMVTGRDSRRVPAPPVRAVDATGAGDAFNGALAAALAGGHDLVRAVQRAVLAGSRAVGAHGARGGLPSAQELDRLVTGR